ncbi:MAG: hypothetical protein ACJ76H_04815 [Bacteriovoracaceae bacterium]
MKYFLLAVLFSATAYSSTFGKYRSTPEGVASQKFILNETNATFEKTSNYFDLKDRDYAIGILKLEKVNEDYKTVMKKIDEYGAKFKEVDDYLKTKGSSFNEVAGLLKHQAVILVNDYRVMPESKYYAELDGLFKKLQKLDWKLTKGYRVTEDLQKVLEIDEGKAVKTSPFARDLYCQKIHPPTICTPYGGGQIYVK